MKNGEEEGGGIKGVGSNLSSRYSYVSVTPKVGGRMFNRLNEICLQRYYNGG